MIGRGFIMTEWDWIECGHITKGSLVSESNQTIQHALEAGEVTVVV